MARIVVQRARSGRVLVDGQTVGRLPEPGLVLLVGLTHSDTPALLDRLADKIWSLRILEDEKSASDVDAPLLVVSQFTLYADVRKGRRPSWSSAAPGEVSAPLFEHFVASLRRRGAHVETGIFGAHMQVELVNDGPVTVIVDSDEIAAPRPA